MGRIPGRPLHDATSIRACDRLAIDELHVPGTTLMAAAAGAVAAAIRRRHPSARRIVCVCGSGANGGDGLLCAAILRRDGVDARAVIVADRPYRGDAAWAEGEAIAAGVPVARDGDVAGALAGAELAVDALLGTGAAGAPRGAVAAAIAAIAAAGVPVVAVDVPSGVDASTGEAAGAVVQATATVTFHAAKIGLVVAPGRSLAGEVEVAPIGIPGRAEAPAPAVLAGAEAVAALPGRDRGGSKYDAGAVLLVGGSTGLTGAIALASRAALRAGAGIVVSCVPASLNAILEVKLTEPMTQPCADDDGALTPAAADVILARAERADAVVLGPGIGRAPGAAELVRALCRSIQAPLLLDADGLHALGDDLEPLRGRRAPTVVTPHGGEAARLLGWPPADVRARRLAAAREIADRAEAVCLLKGPDTIVAAPDGTLAVRDGDEPAIATAGAGDVLAGTCGALLARATDPALAAAAAVAAHLEAARAARARSPRRVLIAGDIVDALALG